MSYVVVDLDELADLFKQRAEEAWAQSKRAATTAAAASYRGEATGWEQAEHITRRTTVKEQE